jgi:enoyl-CoA hydratase
MTFANLLVEDRAAVRLITVNRPDKLNALNNETVHELRAAFGQIRADANVRVVVLTGSGSKAFVAGADINELSSLTPVQARDFSRFGQETLREIETLGKPVIAALNGFTLGGGMELAMSCHLRIATDTAKLGQPEINLGIIPGFGGSQRLLKLCSRAAALELCLLGAPITAERAFQLGIINKVVAADQLMDAAMQWANTLANSAPHALRSILDAVIFGGDCATDQGLAFETQAFAVCVATDDMREGTNAFVEKRKAQFQGK